MGTTPSTEAGTSLRRRSASHDERFAHRGFALDARIGTLGCIKSLCKADNHHVRPGVRFDGFIGGNIRGWVEVGLGGGWGTLASNPTPGTNLFALYGFDASILQQSLGQLAGQAIGINLSGLTVESARLRSAQAGPLLRVHFIPRGRFEAFVGSGFQYNLFRGRYDTAAGAARLDFHGFAVPIEAAFGVHVHRNITVGAQFDYRWTWYGLVRLEHDGGSYVLPVRILDEAAKLQGRGFSPQLPQFWTFGVALRARV